MSQSYSGFCLVFFAYIWNQLNKNLSRKHNLQIHFPAPVHHCHFEIWSRSLEMVCKCQLKWRYSIIIQIWQVLLDNLWGRASVQLLFSESRPLKRSKSHENHLVYDLVHVCNSDNYTKFKPDQIKLCQCLYFISSDTPMTLKLGQGL